MKLFLAFMLSGVLSAAQPPVVFVNGYELICALTSGFKSSYANADQLFASAGIKTAFYDTCSCDRCAIETHGQRLGALIDSLKNDDGTPVSQVDVVTTSMGGLILRSYLAGKAPNARSFTPPVNPKVRKAVFIATPNFGLLAPELDDNLTDMQLGSRFVWEMATWNQGSDDLRGVDAIAIAGEGGSNGISDGLVPLSSASLFFARPELARTRVLPYCHTNDIPLFVQCSSSAPPIAKMDSTTHPTYRIIHSFLTRTDEWRTVGTAASDDAALSKHGGVVTSLHDAADNEVKLSGVTAAGITDTSATYVFSTATSNVFYREWMTAQPYLVTFNGSTNAQASMNVPGGGMQAFPLKLGPAINRVYSAAAATPFLSVAPGMIVAIYGNGFAAGGGTTVQLDGQTLPLTYTSDTQVNAILSSGVTGWRALTVQNGSGKHTVNIVMEPSVPTLFSSDASGRGQAAATDASTGVILTPTLPVHVGEFVALYGTGLGDTQRRNNLDYSIAQPVVTVAGVPARVLYAGRAPQYPGLDQINIEIPSGVLSQAAAPVVVQSGIRSSNVVTLAVE